MRRAAEYSWSSIGIASRSKRAARSAVVSVVPVAGTALPSHRFWVGTDSTRGRSSMFVTTSWVTTEVLVVIPHGRTWDSRHSAAGQAAGGAHLALVRARPPPRVVRAGGGRGARAGAGARVQDARVQGGRQARGRRRAGDRAARPEGS